MAPAPMNRWTRALRQRPSTISALAMFGFFIAGSMLVIISSLAALAGLLLVGGAVGSGWGGRLAGIAVLAGAVACFLVGRWATYQFRVQRRS